MHTLTCCDETTWTKQSQASLITSCIVTIFNPIELWSTAMHWGGGGGGGLPIAMYSGVVHRNFLGNHMNTFQLY